MGSLLSSHTEHGLLSTACQLFCTCLKPYHWQHQPQQFHVIYDDFFETVHTIGDNPPDIWSDLFIVQTYHAHLNDDDPDSIPELSDEWLNPS